jgi:hypothetical protein
LKFLLILFNIACKKRDAKNVYEKGMLATFVHSVCFSSFKKTVFRCYKTIKNILGPVLQRKTIQTASPRMLLSTWRDGLYT